MPPITSISSVPPSYTRSEPRVRDRQRVATEVVDQVQSSLSSRPSQAPLVAATQTQAREAPQPTLRPPLDTVQRLFSERQATLREAALQRDAVLQQQDDDQPLRPIAQAQREADRLQVLRDAQLLQTQRLAAQRVAPARDAERLLAERETLRSEEQRLAEQLTQREAAARLEEQRLQEQRLEEEEAERLEAQRLEEERELTRVEERQEAVRLREQDAQREALRVQSETESDRLEAERSESGRVLVERAALAYRSESERALAEATSTRFEAEQPLSEQFRLARERLDALEATRIDRIDVSEAAFSRLAF